LDELSDLYLLARKRHPERSRRGADANTRGTLYFDDFESRRFSYIGILTDPGVDDPSATNQAGWFTRTYAYSATIPHAVVSVTSEQSAVDSYEYDANGNMICRIEGGVTYSQAYNAENRISSIAKRSGDCTTGTILESWSFAYDGDGVRVLTAHFTGTSGTPDSTTSYYMGGQYEVKDSAVKKYYSIAGMMVAVNDGTGLQYLLTDHLGSTVAVTNSSGTLTSQQRYLPFGETRAIPNSPILGTDFTYTSQRKLDDGMGGIMDYKARFYSPYLNRFLQPDTVTPTDTQGTMAWNRYAYVSNNPIRYSDPTGHCVAICIAIALVGLTIAMSQIPSDVQQPPSNQGSPDVMLFGLSLVVGAPAISTMIGEGLMGLGQAVNSPRIFSAGVSAYNAINGATTTSTAVNSSGQSTAIVPYNKNTAITTYYPPNRGGVGAPDLITLNEGTIIARRGPLFNAEYATAYGYPPYQLSLPPGKEKLPEILYNVLKPIHFVERSRIAPWFNQPGGGIQYYFGQFGRTLDSLLKNGYIEPK
jgi:RHS repeat-associated protein